MASAMEIEASQNLRKQLALAVRSIQWSYAIFWSITSSQAGVLKWDDGYYNGDIKTRKTVQYYEESNPDHLGLQRSDELRELFESLSIDEDNSQAARPMAALSPEDLTDAEWYFLICMSFVFGINQGLPGKTLAKNQTIWLCNAHHADTKVFSRSLLAKSASIKTIVCFPHLGGVVELGTTEPVPEDLDLIHRIKTSFLASPEIVPKISNPASNAAANINIGQSHEALDRSNNIHEDDGFDQLLDYPLVNLVEGVDGGEASRTQRWPFMDDATNNCLNISTNTSDCVSKNYEEPNTIVHTDKQECSHQNNNSDLQGNDFHLQSVLSNLFKNSHRLILGRYSTNVNGESSFVSWTKDFEQSLRLAQSGTPQKLLKKVLFRVSNSHNLNRLDTAVELQRGTRQDDERDRNNVLSERKRREKISERFAILGSLIPSGGKVDKVSLLDRAIEHLRRLERKVREQESFEETIERESTTQDKTQDAMERTSDNYAPNGTAKKPLEKKRKAYDACKTGAETRRDRSRDSDSSTDKVSVDVSEKDILIEVRCSWRELLLFEIMEAINKLHMEPETVKSSISDGVLSMSMKAKCKGLKAASASVIKHALQKVIKKS